MLMELGLAVPDAQRTTDGVGSYVVGQITKSSMGLGLTVPDAQCTTDGVGSYAGSEITKSSMELGLTVPDAQHTTDGVGSIIATISMTVLGSHKRYIPPLSCRNFYHPYHEVLCKNIQTMAFTLWWSWLLVQIQRSHGPIQR